MSWLLNIIYAICLLAASPWLLWRFLFQNKSRRGWTHKLLGRVPRRNSNAPCVWFHAVSVGEVNLLKPLIVGLRQSDPTVAIVISTSTETGYDFARNKYPEQIVFFCPMDFSWAIRQTLKRIKPDLLVLTELEIWPNLVLNTRAFGANVMIANARLSESSFRGYLRFRFLIEPVLKSLNLIAPQNQEYAERFRRLGCPESQIITTGNIKFDNARFDRTNPRSQELSKLLPAHTGFVLVAGSTQFEEDIIVVESYQRIFRMRPEFQLVLVPRHPDRCERLAHYLQLQKIPFALRSGLTKTMVKSSGDAHNPILVVDVIGELGAWWGTADAAFVGGSMGSRGGQNMIEPAAFGIPVSFGPHTENFRNVVQQLLERKAAVVVSNQPELEAFIRRSIDDREWAAATGNRARKLVLDQQGATQRTLECLLGLVNRTLPNTRRAA